MTHIQEYSLPQEILELVSEQGLDVLPELIRIVLNSAIQVREGGFYPQSLDKGQRSEQALKLALAEMYVQGVSTRKVAAITEELCGFSVSSTQVSQAAATLDRTESSHHPKLALPAHSRPSSRYARAVS